MPVAVLPRSVLHQERSQAERPRRKGHHGNHREPPPAVPAHRGAWKPSARHVRSPAASCLLRGFPDGSRRATSSPAPRSAATAAHHSLGYPTSQNAPGGGVKQRPQTCFCLRSIFQNQPIRHGSCMADYIRCFYKSHPPNLPKGKSTFGNSYTTLLVTLPKRAVSLSVPCKSCPKPAHILPFGKLQQPDWRETGFCKTQTRELNRTSKPNARRRLAPRNRTPFAKAGGLSRAASARHVLQKTLLQHGADALPQLQRASAIFFC